MSDHNIKKFVVPPLGGQCEIKDLQHIEKFAVPPLGGQCEIKDLKHHASPPKGGTTNFSNISFQFEQISLINYLFINQF